MRLKLLVLTNLFPTPWDPLRGAFNRQQFERLGQRHHVHVLTAVDFRERMRGVRSQVEVPGLRTDHFVFVFPPGIGRSLHAGCWLASLLLQHGRRLRAENYDGILASWAYPDAVAAGWLARRIGIPYVVKVHGSDLNVMAEDKLRRPQIRSALRHAGAVVAVSQALADKAVVIGADPSRVHTIYNGVDEQRFAPGEQGAARQRLQLAADHPLLLYVGNLKSTKGCIDLLEAFPAVLANRPQARLVYVGTGTCRAELQQRATALGCSDRVDLVGAVPHAQLGDWFRAADVLCLPSHNEGVPNVVLEAMACGIPVVASRVGGIPEVLPAHAGILVPVRKPAALSAALIDATARDWDRDRIVEHARGFRWDDNIDRLDEILQTVIANRG
ncbi:MAG TPA: glycosyltransferase family 4 protein [Rhodanobacter sp.]|nr:glycosyltransferase family 4 protein [Rhodanobacter sp.]